MLKMRPSLPLHGLSISLSLIFSESSCGNLISYYQIFRAPNLYPYVSQIPGLFFCSHFFYIVSERNLWLSIVIVRNLFLAQIQALDLFWRRVY